MKKLRPLLFLTALVLPILLLPHLSRAQMNLGQYEDEAPLTTWNYYGLANGTSLGMGGTLYAFSRHCSSSLANPALLSHLPRFTLTLNSYYSSSSLFKYAIVNTGVVVTDQKPQIRIYALDFGGASVNVRGWILSFSRAMTEVYDRPSVEQSYYYQDVLYYTLNFDQEGHLMITHLAVARRIGRRLSVGIGLNFLKGSLTKTIKEEYPRSNITITDHKSYEFEGRYLNGGLWLRLSKKLELAAVFRAPFTKKAASESSYSYLSPGGDTDIRIDASGENSYKQPLVIGLGLSSRISPRLRAASDFSFFNWSKYKVTYFGEELKRDFKDILKIGAGFEYLAPLRLFGVNLTVPLRAGFTYDPQPMREPGSSYYYFSLGTGLRQGNSSFDVGASFGSERGSGDSLSAKRVAMSLSFRL
jgi:hypothetical protein